MSIIRGCAMNWPNSRMPAINRRLSSGSDSKLSRMSGATVGSVERSVNEPRDSGLTSDAPLPPMTLQNQRNHGSRVASTRVLQQNPAETGHRATWSACRFSANSGSHRIQWIT
jgi:hypothetical protein